MNRSLRLLKFIGDLIGGNLARKLAWPDMGNYPSMVRLMVVEGIRSRQNSTSFFVDAYRVAIV